MNSNFEPIGVLDIGSYQLKFIIFKIHNFKFEILSKSISYTSGIKKGSISDLGQLSESIKNIIGKVKFLITFNPIFKDRAVLPIEGRPAIIIKSDF